MRYRTNYELLFSFQSVCEKIIDGMYETKFHFVGTTRYNRLFFLRIEYGKLICHRMDH